jgi:hypothetical protein
MTDIKVPPEFSNTAVDRYVKRMLGQTSISDLTIYDGPCPTCIVLPMCLNKDSTHILHCPILFPLFYRICLSLKHNPSADISSTSHILRVHPLDVTFWIQRNDVRYGHVDIIKDGYLQFISYRIVFSEEDTE